MGLVVFLDLYGVLVDSALMERAYNERMAAILQRRFGGDLEAWRRSQAESYVWYQQRGAELDRRDGADREGDAWVEAVADLNASQLENVLQRMGVGVPAHLRNLSEAIEEETVLRIDATYPDAGPALAALREDGHRLFLSTNANRANAESALIGGGIREYFDGLLMLETARAKKDRPYYWRRAFEHAGTSPAEAVVVDDHGPFLSVAEDLGARPIQLIRPTLRRQRGRGPVIESLAELPPMLR